MATIESEDKPMSPRAVVERFVWRARRVEAHSLVQSGDAERYSKRWETYTIAGPKVTLVDDNVPTDEEAIESLAARLRPFIVSSESIHLPKVIRAINDCVPDGSLTGDERSRLDSVESWFKHRSSDKDVFSYALQLIGEDGVQQTEQLTDSDLAESWVYSDLVHADPTGKKKQGLKFDYAQRYEAGSLFFCELAGQVVGLLSLVRDLAAEGRLKLSEDSLKSPVTYAEANAADKPQVLGIYILPLGATPPRNGDWEGVPGVIDVTKALAGNEALPEDKAEFISFDDSGKPTGVHPARFIRKEGTLSFLIDGALELTVPLSVRDGDTSKCSISDVKQIGADADRYHKIRESMSAPRHAALRFSDGGKSYAMMAQLEEASNGG